MNKPKTAKEAHEAYQRNFKRNIESAKEDIRWWPSWQGGDGRIHEAMEMWYKANPEKDIRKSLELEPDECPDPNCAICYGDCIY